MKVRWQLHLQLSLIIAQVVVFSQVTDEDLLKKYLSGELEDLKFVEQVLKGIEDKNGKRGSL